MFIAVVLVGDHDELGDIIIEPVSSSMFVDAAAAVVVVGAGGAVAVFAVVGTLFSGLTVFSKYVVCFGVFSFPDVPCPCGPIDPDDFCWLTKFEVTTITWLCVAELGFGVEYGEVFLVVAEGREAVLLTAEDETFVN